MIRLILSLWIFTCAVLADWRTSQVFYWFNNTQPAVALTSSNIVSVDHATGSVTGVQVGDYTGILSGLCTGLVANGTCGGTILDCQWSRLAKNEFNDTYFFKTCRPIVSGITPIATNIAIGLAVTWFSINDHVWYNGNLTFYGTGSLHTFPDGETGWYGIYIFDGHQASGGDSSSPIFTVNGDYMGCVTSIGGGQTIGAHLFPSGSTYRSVIIPANTVGATGFSALFNSDPDR